MNSSTKPTVSIKEVRVLADNYSQNKLEDCLNLAINNSANPCFSTTSNDDVVSTLAKASFVRKQIDQGKSLSEAMRELAKRIRVWV